MCATLFFMLIKLSSYHSVARRQRINVNNDVRYDTGVSANRRIEITMGFRSAPSNSRAHRPIRFRVTDDRSARFDLTRFYTRTSFVPQDLY